MYIDLLIKIKNAEAARKDSLKTRHTQMDAAVVDVLARHGFLKKYEVKGRLPKRVIEIDFNLERPILGIKLLSRPSRRLYAGYKDFKTVKSGYGILVVSTPQGVMSGVEAKKKKVGGQLLFEIW